MAEENKNHFILDKIFPNIKSLLIKKKSIEEILRNAIFVLDTNSLLAPYQTGKDDIEKIRNTYSKLIAENRLFIPEHALKEFAKNRSGKISDLFSNIDNYTSTIPSVKSFEYPILGELDAYKALNEARIEVTSAIKKYGECLKELKNGIADWNWSDPVTLMYSDTFTDKIIFSSTTAKEELLVEYNSRLEADIPPGNKDKSKESNAIGDFLIWKSIIELGINENKDIVFISNDEKNDWLLKGNKKSISTRYELVHEYFEETKGCNFLCMTFSAFLDNQGVEINFFDDFDFDLLLDDYSQSLEKPSETLESLGIIYKHISFFLINQGPEFKEEHINDKINESIKKFNAIHKTEFFESAKWKTYHHYFFRFSEWLTKIMEYNNEIIYQEIRMKRDTDSERIQMIALAKEFVNLYEEFETIK